MRVYEILTETKQLQEGPILNKIGRGIGKTVGTVAKGVGAVAGGIAGIGRAVKKGYQAGKATVGGAGDDVATTAAPGKPSAAAPTSNVATGQSTQPAATAPVTSKSTGTAAPSTSSKASAPADDNQVINTPTGKVKLKDIKTAMSTMKGQQLKKIKSAIDTKLQKVA